jgi:hypothetical protein
MNDDTPDDAIDTDIRSFTLLASDADADTNHLDHDCDLHVTITLHLPGGWGTNTLPLTAAAEVLDRLERDGLRPYRTTVEIVEKPTA